MKIYFYVRICEICEICGDKKCPFLRGDAQLDFLKEWVRGLVMLVILATCLEMMLPMTAMKKYVRMTMGLLVVLAVIQPVLGFMHQTVTVTNLFPDDNGGNLPTIAQIMSQADQFREKNRTLALTEAQTRLTAEAVAAARSVKGVAGARADVQFDLQQGEYRLRSVTVTITPGEGAGGGPTAVRPIKPVQPVRSVQPGTEAAAVPAGQSQSARAPAGAEQALAESVRHEVAARVGLTAQGAVTVLIEGR
jgi:stage III sporulation protein AF